MNTLLQITCRPGDWDTSTITACGLTRNGRTLTPQTIAANQLPEPWLGVWRGLAAAVGNIAPGEWAAILIMASRVEARVEAEGTEGTEEAETEGSAPQPRIRLTVYRQWDDGTTASPVILEWEQDAALSLYGYLTNTHI